MHKKPVYICAISAITLLLLSRFSTPFAEWYARYIFPLFPQILGRLFSVCPFSVAEILLILALPAAFFLRLRLLRKLPLIAACLLLLFTLACGINYQRDSIAVELGIEARPSSAQELRRLYDILAGQAMRDCGPVSLDRRELHSEARQAMRQLTGGYFPRPKPLLLSEGMSWLNLSGVYSPFTVEANYNSHIPLLSQPFTVCHELAHAGGYSREDEANFIAYLACQQSGKPAFRYSGTFQALIYVLNALYGVLPAEEYALLYQQLPPQTHLDLQQNAAYWQRYEGRAAELSENVNDAYLKANSQADGVQSYGRMVDLLLAYYIST